MWIEEVYFTKHHVDRMAEREISTHQCIETTKSPNLRRQQMAKGTHGGVVYRFEKQFDEGILAVTVELYKGKAYFITGYWL